MTRKRILETGKNSLARLPDAACFSGHDAAEARRASGRQPTGPPWRVGQVIAGAVEPNAVAVFAGDNPKTIVLDLMQPLAADGKFIGFSWKTRRE
jgi:hypothetical protein